MTVINGENIRKAAHFTASNILAASTRIGVRTGERRSHRARRNIISGKSSTHPTDSVSRNDSSAMLLYRSVNRSEEKAEIGHLVARPTMISYFQPENPSTHPADSESLIDSYAARSAAASSRTASV